MEAEHQFSVETKPDSARIVELYIPLSPFTVVPANPKGIWLKSLQSEGEATDQHRAGALLTAAPASPEARVLGCGDTGREDGLPCLWLSCHHHPHPHHCEMSITEWPQGHSTKLTLPQRDPTDQLADSYLPTRPRTKKECWEKNTGS